MKDISELTTPVEIDTAIAESYAEKRDLEFRIDRLRNAVEYYQKRTYYAYNIEETKKEIQDLLNILLEKHRLIEKLENKYEGWSRAYLVSNANGHIHASTNCSTCFPSTQYIWITELSGQDRLEIAGLAGEKACSVCYPDAPSEYFARKCQIEDPAVVKARAEREAKKAEREAKRLATGIWNPDNSELRVQSWSSSYSETLKTERTARIWAKDQIVWTASSNSKTAEKLALRERTLVEIEKVLVAIANKTGQDLEIVRAEITEKARKEIQKIQRETEAWLVANPQYRNSEYRVEYELA